MDVHKADPTILFLHDGELADFRETLSTLGSGVTERASGPSDHDFAAPWDMVLASSKRMLELPNELSKITSVRIAVLNGDSKTLRTMLRNAGTDLMVRRPVHPTALRLLILHALYRGPEKRRTSRVSVGAAISYRDRFRRRNAILAELSPTGCRVLAPIGSHSRKSGSTMTLQFPAELCAGRPLSLSGRVLRVDTGDCGTDTIAVSFESLRTSVAERLRSVIDAHTEGPAILASEAAAALDSLPETIPPDPSAAQSYAERRQQQRHSMERRVIALGEQAARVLMGRDLSLGGMRVDAASGLGVGDKLKIALHVQTDGQPLVLNVEVSRDDGDTGLALHFVDLEPGQIQRLKHMLDLLPPISDSDDEADKGGIFVSEVLARQSA